jgi:hypothetical protein
VATGRPAVILEDDAQIDMDGQTVATKTTHSTAGAARGEQTLAGTVRRLAELLH